MKKRIFFALKSLKATIPISLILFAILLVVAMLDYEGNLNFRTPEWVAMLAYTLIWGIPSVTIVWRLFSYSENAKI